MRIECPFCGSRDVSEFAYLGDASCRPAAPGPGASRECYEAAYLRNNPAGPHEDLWYHAGGCRSWLRVSRDTRTHEIFGATLVTGMPS